MQYDVKKREAVPHGRVCVLISIIHHIQSIIIHPCPMLMLGVMEK